MSLQSVAEFFRLAGEARTKLNAEGTRIVLDCDRETAIKAADTGHEAVQNLCNGLAALGVLIAKIDHADKGFNVEGLSSVGWMVTNLADLAYVMNEATNDIESALRPS